MNKFLYPSHDYLDREQDFGICDLCSAYTEDLTPLGGDWMCGSCVKRR